ncbi:hypothetical protein B0T16DRAFT_331368 [Cercophora newfieldiana]|uniref:Cytochrome P450 n=1 Tax=Cercophora newfieldiana TaxID=92897 RepID=A0AA40CLB1_9PEZI|nr:hypothetical protein B0T16DRAFT_331368 [Cercophora newfieldiana]
MASNTPWSGAIPDLTDGALSHFPLKIPAAIVIAGFVAFLLHYLAVPRLDPREPPLVKPRIPLIGHIISLIQHQAEYHTILRQALCRTPHPIATLPMLNGKMYAVWDPTLVAAGLRNKHLSTLPQAKAVTPALCGITAETDAIIQGPMGEKVINDVFAALAPAFVGEHLQRLNSVALSYLGRYFNGLADETEQTVPNVWMWIRGLMTEPTAKAVFGNDDPFSREPGLEQAL